MSLYWNDLGERYMLNRALTGGSIASGTLSFSVSLYTNNYTYVDDSFDGSDFDEVDDGTWTWYSSASALNWNAATTNASGDAECICSDTLTFSTDGTGGAVTCYGYFLSVNNPYSPEPFNDVVAFQPFASPRTLTAPPDALTINLKITLKDDND